MADQYSLWALAPTAHLGLRPATEYLQRTYGGPEFEPHVTILGSVTLPSLDDAVAKLQELAQALDPITYRIQGVGHGSTYFQSVFLTVDPTPQVVQANARAKEVFQVTESENNAYFPHLSLIYGDLKDEDKRQAKASAEEKFGDILLSSEFLVSRLSLWATDTEDKLLTSWKMVAEYPLVPLIGL